MWFSWCFIFVLAFYYATKCFTWNMVDIFLFFRLLELSYVFRPSWTSSFLFYGQKKRNQRKAARMLAHNKNHYGFPAMLEAGGV